MRTSKWLETMPRRDGGIFVDHGFSGSDISTVADTDWQIRSRVRIVKGVRFLQPVPSVTALSRRPIPMLRANLPQKSAPKSLEGR
jgi:hypothetical protein